MATRSATSGTLGVADAIREPRTATWSGRLAVSEFGRDVGDRRALSQEQAGEGVPEIANTQAMFLGGATIADNASSQDAGFKLFDERG
jgi:hypothetical protein